MYINRPISMAILIPRLRRFFASNSIVQIANPHRGIHAFQRFHRHRHGCTRCDSRYGNSPLLKYIFESESTVPVNGCSDSDTTIRCNEGNGNTAWKNTQTCMDKLGNTADCYCYGSLLYYAVANDNFQAFEDCCFEESGSRDTTYCG